MDKPKAFTVLAGTDQWKPANLPLLMWVENMPQYQIWQGNEG